ncbi:hypothetical protein [Streptomyces yanii]|uniref:Integral membrane protein n=1 Tax=Streptomyces yanii TaxID=78510 RepID=A0ABV5R7E7_9ACTN
MRAETLAALTRPGLAPLRLLVRAPLASLAALSVTVGAVALAVPAFHLPWWVSFAGLVLCLPDRLLALLLRAARRRAATTTPPTGAEEPDPTAYRSWAVSRSESWLTGTPRTVLGALVLRFRILVGDAYPVCAPFQAGGIPTTWPCGCGHRRRGGPEPSRW